MQAEFKCSQADAKIIFAALSGQTVPGAKVADLTTRLEGFLNPEAARAGARSGPTRVSLSITKPTAKDPDTARLYGDVFK